MLKLDTYVDPIRVEEFLDGFEKGKKQGREEALNVLEERMYVQCFEKDNPEDMQKWDGGNWIRYKLFETVLETMREDMRRNDNA